MHSDVKVQGRTYAKTKFDAVPEPCTDIIWGQDFLNQHEEVVLKREGPQENVVIGVDSSYYHGDTLTV